jgi:hypothetical protein
MIDLKVYLMIITNIKKMEEDIFSINNNDINIESFIDHFFYYYNGVSCALKPKELEKVKSTTKHLTWYKVPAHFYKPIPNYKNGCCNGFVNLQVMQVDFATFNLRKFIDSRKNV